ncbi:hypothetical protein [Natronoglomus mannanivorans]|uniref:Uncharacterized protein n=1 Tax=Natronoglomus mannanivorans TaxID=2979990 RepID=A0AAP2Z176_9EURY|nr:hypothetical protein [Halobacteria archaeon AArc-xg1-1]
MTDGTVLDRITSLEQYRSFVLEFRDSRVYQGARGVTSFGGQ